MVQRRIVPTMSCFGQFILWRSGTTFGAPKNWGFGFSGWPAITNLINNVFRVFCNRLCFSCIMMTGKRGGGRRDGEVLPASRADGFRYVSIMAQFIWMIVAGE